MRPDRYNNFYGMRCLCGYKFSPRSEGAPPYESYAIVDNKDYGKFIKLETKITHATDGSAALAAISRSSMYVGSLLECPKCSRLLLLKPVGSSSGRDVIFYQRESLKTKGPIEKR